ncbi:DUF4097 family beta strand repeat protein [candidate division KSB1 bacterium]|nr:DUF4097 family beta strand repeat protein [candidate division KSB1 bacterium]
MKYKTLAIMAIFFMFTFNQNVFSADEVDRLAVKFTNPDKPGYIEVGLINGGVTVEGYNGNEVIIEARSRTREIVTDEKKRKVDGMKRIPIKTTGLSVEEDENRMEISVESWRRTIDLKLRVPFNTSMKVNCVNAGDIFIQNVNGEFDINNVNGKVTLQDISGSVMAHALNKDLVVTFKKIDSEKAMSFSTLNGDVDVTFPENLKANVKLKSDNGEIYSDFEIKLDATPREVVEENNRGKSGKYRVKIDHTVQGKINGGGPEFQFTTFNGDVIIRMKK